jgi:hypothetical protein
VAAVRLLRVPVATAEGGIGAESLRRGSRSRARRLTLTSELP